MLPAEQYQAKYLKFASTYGDDLADMVYPTGLMAEYQDNGQTVMINNNSDFVNMCAEMEESKRASYAKAFRSHRR